VSRSVEFGGLQLGLMGVDVEVVWVDPDEERALPCLADKAGFNPDRQQRDRMRAVETGNWVGRNLGEPEQLITGYQRNFLRGRPTGRRFGELALKPCDAAGIIVPGSDEVGLDSECSRARLLCRRRLGGEPKP
jgi:hypothetical protein